MGDPVRQPWAVRSATGWLRDPDRGRPQGIPCVTTVAGLSAAVQGIEAIIRGEVGVRSLQEYAGGLRGVAPPGKRSG